MRRLSPSGKTIDKRIREYLLSEGFDEIHILQSNSQRCSETITVNVGGYLFCRFETYGPGEEPRSMEWMMTEVRTTYLP